MSFQTPSYRLSDSEKSSVYDPAEDTFLLLDALEKDSDKIRHSNPRISLEIGSGTGIVSAFCAKFLPENSCLLLATDINPNAVRNTVKTAGLNDVNVEVVHCDLAGPLTGQLGGKVDLLLFNPPYVPTASEELSEGKKWFDTESAENFQVE